MSPGESASCNNESGPKPNDGAGDEEEDEYAILMRQMQGEIENTDKPPPLIPSAPTFERQTLVQTLLAPVLTGKQSMNPFYEPLPVPELNSNDTEADTYFSHCRSTILLVKTTSFDFHDCA